MTHSLTLTTPILSLDVGEHRIGLAVCGEARRIARPLGAIRRRRLAVDLAAILRRLREQRAGMVLVGLPFSLDGTLGPQAHSTLVFCDVLRAALREEGLDVPVETWDERFTSVEAERLLREKGRLPSRASGRFDALAAAIILQSYLDAVQRNGRESQPPPEAPGVHGTP